MIDMKMFPDSYWPWPLGYQILQERDYRDNIPIEKNRALLDVGQGPYRIYQEFHCKIGCSNCKYKVNDSSYFAPYSRCKQLYFDTHYVSVLLGVTDDADRLLIKDKISAEEWLSMINTKSNVCREAKTVCSNCKWGQGRKAIFVEKNNERIDISGYLSCIDYYRLARKEKKENDNRKK